MTSSQRNQPARQRGADSRRKPKSRPLRARPVRNLTSPGQATFCPFGNIQECTTGIRSPATHRACRGAGERTRPACFGGRPADRTDRAPSAIITPRTRRAVGMSLAPRNAELNSAVVSVYRVADARSADLQSAVSQVCNLRIARKIPSLGSDRHLADYKSALRQIENLRYGKQILSLWERVNHSRRGEQ